MRNVKADGTRRRSLTNDNVEKKVLHSGIEDLFDLVVETVYLVHKENIALLEIGEDGGKISRAGDSRPRGGAQACSHLVCHHVGERGLSQARRTREEHVVKRLVAVLGSCDEHAKVVANALLATVLIERGGTKAAVYVKVICRELARHGTWSPVPVTRARHVVEEILFLSLPRHRLPPILLSAN